jgi:hypothetical protein
MVFSLKVGPEDLLYPNPIRYSLTGAINAEDIISATLVYNPSPNLAALAIVNNYYFFWCLVLIHGFLEF